MVTRIIKSSLTPSPLARPVALSSEGLLRYWATVYEIVALSGLQDRTARSHLLSIDAFYSFVETLRGEDCLDQILHFADLDTLGVCLEAFFFHEQNAAAQLGVNRNGRWQYVTLFVFSILQGAADSDANVQRLKDKLSRVQSRILNLTPNPQAQKLSVIRALPSAVIQDLYEIFNPESNRNPFRSEKQRWRNHSMFLLLLHEGLRRSEALLLSTDSFKSGRDECSLGIRYWVNVQNEFADEDPRYCDPPSIKNSQSIRQIPISQMLSEHIRYFILNYRGKSPYPHLFLNSSGVPLSSRSVSKIMLKASASLTAESKSALSDYMREPCFSAHDLRHTCAVVKLSHYRSAGVSEEDALQKLRANFGWTFESSMPRLYARAYWERHISETWNDDFDAHVNALRSIEHGRERF